MLVSDRKRASSFSIDSIMASEPAKRRAPILAPRTLSPVIQTPTNYHHTAMSPPEKPHLNLPSKLFHESINTASSISHLHQQQPPTLPILPPRQPHVSELERLVQYPFYSWFMSRHDQFHQHQLQGYLYQLKD